MENYYPAPPSTVGDLSPTASACPSWDLTPSDFQLNYSAAALIGHAPKRTPQTKIYIQMEFFFHHFH